MTTTNPTTTWHLSQMPNLIETLQQLSNAGVEIIGISTQNEPLCLCIHCYNGTECTFTEWAKTQEWELRELEDSIYPAEIFVYLNGCRVFGLINKREWEKWEEGDNA